MDNKAGETPIKEATVRLNPKTGKREVIGIIKTTIGRLIYNDGLPQDLGFVKRDTPEAYLRLELDTEFIGSARDRQKASFPYRRGLLQDGRGAQSVVRARRDQGKRV